MLIFYEFLMIIFFCVDFKYEFFSNLYVVCNFFNGNEGILNVLILWLCVCIRIYMYYVV